MSSLHEVWVENRRVLTSVAYEIIGEWSAAEDITAGAWERAQREISRGRHVEHPAAWLRTVTTRMAIDEARSARVRREKYVGTWLPEPVPTAELPDDVAVTRSMLGLAMMRLVQELDPLERAVFVLREGFTVPYAEIAECVEHSPEACRQIVSRAKRRLPAVSAPNTDIDRRVITALVGAVADGDVAAVVDLISDGCVLWSDGGGVVRVAPRPIVGAEKVARFLVGVHHKNPPITSWWLESNGGSALALASADGTRVVILEHDGRGATGVQMHANPDKLAHVLKRTG